MMSRGILASELIAALQELIRQHGDKQVYSGGTDYPEGVTGVSYTPKGKGDGYTPSDSFKVR